MLILSRKVGESLLIGDQIEVKVTEISGDRIRIGITAPKEYKIMRKELCQTMESNVAASSAPPRADLQGLWAALQAGGPGGAPKAGNPLRGGSSPAKAEPQTETEDGGPGGKPPEAP